MRNQDKYWDSRFNNLFYVSSHSHLSHPRENDLTKQEVAQPSGNTLKGYIMNDREEAELREYADGLFDNMDRDEMEDWFEGDD